MFKVKDGELFVKLARKSIAYYMHTQTILSEKAPDPKYNDEKGVFVTLSNYPTGDLRGCIGFPEPLKPLWNGIIEAAVSAAFADPRFLPLQASELDQITVEISILTKPLKINVKKPEEYLKEIKIGRDGLIVKKGFRSGLLLPQVAVDWGWNAEQFLEQTCWKAGLPKSDWKKQSVEIFKFQAQIFKEERPNGKVVEEKLS